LEPSWTEVLQHRIFRRWFLAAVTSLLSLSLFVPYFFQQVIQPRAAIPVNDPVMNLFFPTDWSLPILSLLYVAIGISFVANFNKPLTILTGISVYGIVTWLRMGTIYAVTLEPPAGVIPLTDPFLKFVVYNRSNFVKDLFFSGHISSMTIMVLLTTNRTLKWLLGLMTLTMAVLLLWQHAHYTVDLIAAPPITYGVYRLVARAVRKLPPN
jgi:hypothetical protein